MKITSKQRAYLKSLAMKEKAIFQIGKSNLTPEIISSVREALDKRELIKISILQNASDNHMNMAISIAERTNSTLVQLIGNKIILYKPSKENIIVLPK